MGGAGQLSKNVYASGASNSALYATFAVVGFFAGTVTNAAGIRAALSFGILCLHQLILMFQPHSKSWVRCFCRTLAWMLCRHSLVRAGRDYDVVSTRETERPIYLLVLDNLQHGRCHRLSGELKSFKIRIDTGS